MDIKEVRAKLYNVYNHVRYRCDNNNCMHYSRYGGRGISNKLGTFEEFFNRMWKSYVEHVKEYGYYETTIERIDNNEDYTYDNITWATRKEQSSNRKTSMYFKCTNTIDGSVIYINNITSFCKRVGIAYTTFREGNVENFNIEGLNIKSSDVSHINNIANNDWCRPIKIYAYKIVNHCGSMVITKNLKQWCRENCVDPSAAYKCVKGKRKTASGYTFNRVIVEV